MKLHLVGVGEYICWPLNQMISWLPFLRKGSVKVLDLDLFSYNFFSSRVFNKKVKVNKNVWEITSDGVPLLNPLEKKGNQEIIWNYI